MMRIFSTIVAALIFVIFGAKQIVGQSDAIYQDIIILNNGFAFKCEILNVDQSGIMVNTKKKDSLFYQHGIIRKVIQKDKMELSKTDTTVSTMQICHGSLQLGLGSGGQSEQLFSSLMIDAGLKIKLFKSSNLHHLRTNIALVNYKGFSNVSTLAWTGGYQLKLMDKAVSPYIFGDFGYGFGLEMEEDNQSQIKTKGGNTYSLGCGLLFKSTYVKSWDVSMGYLSQKTKKDFSFPWQNNTISQNFRRIYFIIGAYF